MFPNSFRTHINQPEFILAMEIERKNQTIEFFPSNTTLNNQGTNLVCCTLSQPLNFPLTLENPFRNNQTAIHPPIAQHISQPNVSGNSKQIPNWSYPGKQLFQPRTEIQTETITFENNFNLQTTNKISIKLPPITESKFNGNPLKYHEWINNCFNLVQNTTSLTDTHRITYLQNSVIGKA